MFSATMPPPVERLAKKYLRRPAIVTIGVAGQAVDTVDQRVEFISSEEKKKSVFADLLRSHLLTVLLSIGPVSLRFLTRVDLSRP